MALNKKLVVSLLILVAAGASNIASAQDDNDYVSLFGGFVGAEESNFQTGLGGADVDFDAGYGFGAALGNILDRPGRTNSVRLETELVHRSSSVDTFTLGGAAQAGAAGDLDTTSIMVNVIAAFNEQAQFTPYLGAGLGGAYIEASSIGSSGLPKALEDNNFVFAFQVIGGFGFDMSPNAEFFVEYRWFATNEAKMTTSPATGRVNTKIDYQTNNILIGVRIRI